METPLLQTKLYIPQLPPNHIARPHLVKILNQGKEFKLSLLAAPAGFGKTSLLCEWVDQLEQPTAWLSLDKNDNDLARFLSYIIAALQQIKDGLGQELLTSLQASRSSPGDILLAMLPKPIQSARPVMATNTDPTAKNLGSI